uniref:Carboxylic ester hydrolase n=1 Tax=Anabas testudineus TaxID=64144 RepID=A0A7N6AJR3_ANATE
MAKTGCSYILTAPEVHTKLGSLRGQYVSVKGKETGVHAYLGVPFAKPPVGPALRLAAPQPLEGWEGVKDATQQPLMCVQHKQDMLDLAEKLHLSVVIPDISEDCLYVNIYTPANRAHDAKLPVMVWIHGGGYTMGSASIYDGSALAAYQDVVVVLIQYRLGLLGFLSTGDEHMPGNLGLLDQVQALKWIQQHIHNFGGDPDLVTIFGESAGGVSVSLLLLSPLSEGLFHRAISESGTAEMGIVVSNNPLQLTQMVANISGCSLESTEKIADCMRNLDIDTIVNIVKDKKLHYSANIDGHFLTKPVDELLSQHQLHTVPFITGVNNDEAGWLIVDFFAPPNWTEGLDREEKDSHRYLGTFFLSFQPLKLLISTEVFLYITIHIYLDKLALINKTHNFHLSVIDAGAPVYLYEYQHPPKFLQEKRPSFVKTDHGDELFTVLGFCFTTTHVKLPDSCPEEEEKLSKIMMSYWGNFARTGSPNGDGLVHWPKYEAGEEYLAIDLKQQVTGQHLKKDRFVFLTQTLPEKVKQHQEKMERREL